MSATFNYGKIKSPSTRIHGFSMTRWFL